MARGRKPIPVEKAKLQEVIANLESASSFTSRNALWESVANTDYAKGIGLSSQVAMLKAKAFGLEIKTPLGKRGRSKGDGPVPNAGKRKGKRIALEIVQEMKKEFHPSLHKKIDRAAKGSMKAAIALKCIDCTAGSKKEVALCVMTTCPLWGYRPYQHKLSKTAEGRAKIIDGSFEEKKNEPESTTLAS
jgi:hypothetical protein